MNAPLRRILGVFGLLAAIAFVILTSRPDQESRHTHGTDVASSTPVATPPSVAQSQPGPSSTPPAPEQSPVTTPPSPAPSTGPSAQPTATDPLEAPAAPRSPMPAPTAGIGPTAPPPAALASEADLSAAETDLEHIRMMVREYRDVVGENPIGTNAEIMKAVMGDNLKQARIGLPEGQALNGKGELVDRWGTPYFFHQVSKSQMEVRSAGPDRLMWTTDDRELK